MLTICGCSVVESPRGTTQSILRKWGEPSTPQMDYAKGALQGEQGIPLTEGRKEVFNLDGWLVHWLAT